MRRSVQGCGRTRRRNYPIGWEELQELKESMQKEMVLCRLFSNNLTQISQNKATKKTKTKHINKKQLEKLSILNEQMTEDMKGLQFRNDELSAQINAQKAYEEDLQHLQKFCKF